VRSFPVALGLPPQPSEGVRDDVAAFVSIASMSLSAFQSSVIAPPSTPKRPVTDEYHGIKVTDDYRWLENWDDPTVKQWAADQDARTRNYLEHLPKYDLIHARIAELIGTPSAWYDSLQFSGGMLVCAAASPHSISNPCL
jgi:prolyl oligopeptidase